MKKGVLIAVVVIILLVIGASGYLATRHSNSSMQPYGQAAKTTPSSVFGSIQDALTNKALSLSCDFTDANGIHVVAYIKSGAIRSDVTGKTPQESGSVLIKDKKMYFWNATMGMMMDMPAMTVTPTPGANTNQTQSTVADLEKYKESCKPAVLSDSLFTLPANVKFTDESQMMQQMHMPTTSPTTSGSTSPSTGGYAIPTQYQQYMQH